MSELYFSVSIGSCAYAEDQAMQTQETSSLIELQYWSLHTRDHTEVWCTQSKQRLS